jgi:hypothetical protein
MSNLSSSVLWNFELPLFQVIKEVSSLQVFHDNVDIVLVFKNVFKFNDVRVLADFQDFDFSFQQFLIFQR